MRQLLGWLSVLVLLGGSAAGWYFQRGGGAAKAAGVDPYADARLSAAAERLEQMGSYLGSYDGIPGDLIVGMNIAYATGDRYCVQLMTGGSWYHRAGPGGSAQPGACV